MVRLSMVAPVRVAAPQVAERCSRSGGKSRLNEHGDEENPMTSEIASTTGWVLVRFLAILLIGVFSFPGSRGSATGRQCVLLL